jgi:hypothetical protein
VGDTRWVVCNGHLAVGASCGVRGRGVLIARRLTTGQFEVIFDINVRACDYVATVGSHLSFGTEPSGLITTVGRATDVRGVFLTTHAPSGAFSDRSWHLTVQC